MIFIVIMFLLSNFIEELKRMVLTLLKYNIGVIIFSSSKTIDNLMNSLFATVRIV
jgi:hypothetical protein